VLGALGMASGAFAARVAEIQIVLIPVSIVSLAMAHYFAYRHGHRSSWQRLLLWIVTAISAGFWVVPLAVDLILSVVAVTVPSLAAYP
jgi:hypothetical protein